MTGQVVDDSIRGEPRPGRWAEAKEAVRSGKTFFVAEPEDAQARNALHQAFRLTPGVTLHRAKRTLNGELGTAFWLETLPTA